MIDAGNEIQIDSDNPLDSGSFDGLSNGLPNGGIENVVTDNETDIEPSKEKEEGINHREALRDFLSKSTTRKRKARSERD